MRKLFIILFLPFLFVSCANTTKDAEHAYNEQLQLNEQRAENLSYAVEGNDLALAQIPEPSPEIDVAREFNKLSRAIIDRPLTPEQQQELFATVLAAIKDKTQLEQELKKKIEEAQDINERLARIEETLNEKLPTVFNQSQTWENENSLWAKTKKVFKWISGLGILGVFIYILMATGLAPLVLPILGKSIGWLAFKFPKLFYNFGVVAKEQLDDVVSGVAKIRENEQKIISSASTTPQQTKDAEDRLEKIDATLRTYVRPNSKTHQLVKHVRTKKDLT